MARAKDPSINLKVMRMVCKFFEQGALKDKIFSILNVILDSDEVFSCTNIEVEFKSFILESHTHKKEARYLKIDGRRFCSAFGKFDGNPSLMKVLNRVCVKKNGLLMVEMQRQNLFFSEFAQQNAVSLNLPNSHTVMVQNLVDVIVREKEAQVRLEYIREAAQDTQFLQDLDSLLHADLCRQGHFLRLDRAAGVPAFTGQYRQFHHVLGSQEWAVLQSHQGYFLLEILTHNTSRQRFDRSAELVVKVEVKEEEVAVKLEECGVDS
jgi:hypothetical protein